MLKYTLVASAKGNENETNKLRIIEVALEVMSLLKITWKYNI